jgi:hypothetical protein
MQYALSVLNNTYRVKLIFKKGKKALSMPKAYALLIFVFVPKKSSSVG